MLKTILKKIWKDKPTGVTCIRCGWNGTRDELMKAPRINENSVVYQIEACPRCYRNGGLEYHS